MQWKTIKGFPDYIVSDTGFVQRIAGGRGATPGRVLKPMKKRNGYFQVALYKNKKPCHISLARLVLTTFVRDCPVGMQANHKDGIKQHNCAENLEWITPKQNIAHAKKLGLINISGGNNHNAKLTNKQVEEIRNLLTLGTLTQVVIAKMFDVRQGHISRIKRGVAWI